MPWKFSHKVQLRAIVIKDLKGRESEMAVVVLCSELFRSNQPHLKVNHVSSVICLTNCERFSV